MSRIAESYLGDTPYPHSPGFKTGGTSKEAAHAVKSDASILRERAYKAIAEAKDGLTADECADAIGRDRLATRPRLSELAKMGRIGRTGERRLNKSGLSASVWCAI